VKKWILLDRDGVINQDSPEYIKSAEEWIPLPGSIEAIAMLTKAGYSIGVATNQSGIARGLYSLATLEEIHAKMTSCVHSAGGQIQSIAYCPHGPEDHCLCRKPRPGLLEKIAQEQGFILNQTSYVGDSFRDLQAALAVQATPILVLSGKGEHTLAQHTHELDHSLVFKDLHAYATHLIQKA
jgi:D-glycero-D-manno-heptose 1,7-bisphosphate phosphatase